MLATDLFHMSTALLRRATRVVAVVCVLALVACGDDDDDGPAGPGDGIVGTWQSTASEEYLRITADEIHLFIGAGACFLASEAEIVARDGDLYTLDFGGIQIEVEIRRSGDNLILSDGEDESVYEPSSVDVDELEICTTPELPACSTLPELGFGTSEIGDLEETDPTDEFGAHFDLYRIEIDGTLPDPVVIEMNSTEFDTYLYVFDEAGNIVGENDDWESGTDSRIDLSQPDGCYIVKASSFDFGVTGGYEVFFF